MPNTPDSVKKLSNLQEDDMFKDGEGFGMNPTNKTRLKKIVQLCQRMKNEVDFRTVSGKVGKKVTNGASTIYDALDNLNRGSGDISRDQRNL